MAVFRSCLDDSLSDTYRCWKDEGSSLKMDLYFVRDSYPYDGKHWNATVLFMLGFALIPPLLLYGMVFHALPWLARWVCVGTAKKEAK